MNTGAEAVETALKLCRKWAYEVKGIPACTEVSKCGKKSQNVLHQIRCTDLKFKKWKKLSSFKPNR